MPVEQDIWLIHPGVNCGRDVDRITFAQIGEAARSTVPGAIIRSRILGALEARYGITAGGLSGLTMAVTSRSRAGEGELIIFPAGMTLAQAEALISPQRAVS